MSLKWREQFFLTFLQWSSAAQRFAVEGVNRLNIRGFRIIEPYFQWHVICFGAGMSLLTTILLGFFVDHSLHRGLEMLAESGLGENSPIYGFVLGQRKMVFFFFSLGFLVSIFASVAWGIYFSHKIAGPLYRLKKHLNETAAGKAAQPLKFRTGDYFQEIADAYNAELVSRGKLKRWGSAPERAYREGKA